jgi:hypothetical protein
VPRPDVFSSIFTQYGQDWAANSDCADLCNATGFACGLLDYEVFMKTFCHIKPILSFIGICSFAAYRGMAYAHCPMSDQINVGPSGLAFATADDDSEFFLISRSYFYAVDSKNGE